LRIFRKRNVTIADVSAAFVSAGMFAMFFFLSLYMQIILHYNALETGLRFLPLAFTIMVSAAVTSQLVTRFGYKYVMAAGMLTAAVGMYLLSLTRVHGSFEHDVLLAMLVVAWGLGMTFVPLQIASVTGVEPSEIGLASGLVNAFLQIGGAIGLAILSTIATTEFNGVMSAGHFLSSVMPNALVAGYHHAYTAGVIFLVCGALIVLTLLPQGGYRGHAEEQQAAEGAA
jgi:predicted MFS family arabinose efflux permease